MSRPVVHEVAGGACIVCGETAEWLLDRGAVVVIAPAPPPVAS